MRNSDKCDSKSLMPITTHLSPTVVVTPGSITIVDTRPQVTHTTLTRVDTGLFSGAVSTQKEVGARCNQYNHYVYILVQTGGLQQSPYTGK